MAMETTLFDYTPKGKIKSKTSLSGLVTIGIIGFLGWLVVGNVILFSSQAMILAGIGVAIWFLTKK